MKILSASIIDPRQNDLFVDPELLIQVDEEVDEIGTPHTKRHWPEWRVIPCGPFVAVEHAAYADVVKGKPNWEETNDLGKFNTLGFWREQLIECEVETPTDRLPLAMGVARMRRLIRKHCPDWEVIVDDARAMEGKILWRVERKDPVCFGPDCPLAPVQIVWYSGAHVPLCEFHSREHQRIVRENRLTRIH